MAESAASALLSVIFEKLTDEALKKFARSQKIDSELNDLQITLSQIKALLNDASQKEITDESVRLWMSSLQHLAYDIDDVLDDVATEAMHHELTQESGASTSMVRKLIPTCCTKFTLSHRLSPKLDIITKKLQYLEKQKSDLGLIVKDEKPKSTSRRDEISLLESDVVGREGETEKLINKLLHNEPSKENFIIVPIVGMGGVGKTTMARILYNDKRVKDHFEFRAWVCVSDVFDIFKISETIFQSVATENKQFTDINQLQVALGEQLKDKRFLIVLDDVWTENCDDWEKLMRPFHLGAHGSRVIMTTRKQQLLQKLGFNQLDHLESLSHEDALCLFAIHALGVDNFDSHPTLKPQGDGIVKKCAGLPLALKAIGRLIKTKTEREEWDDVLNSEIWHLENVDEIVPALRLSFHDLSADLKRLFAYCSLFPKDFLFDKEELVLLWVAEGYLNESLANKSPERLGHEYFEKLLSRSFFQPSPSGESFFVMHDLMNDLATFVAGENFFRFDNQMEMSEEALAKYRHMSFIREEYVAFQKFRAFERARSLRTFLAVYVGVNQSWKNSYLSRKILVDLLPELPLLRVICLSRFKIDEVPDFIGTLKHLRYLNLSKTNIKELPESVGNLYNLQTLIAFGCRSLTKLPKSFMKLTKLRHFDIRDTPLLKKLPLGIGELKSLQTLTKIIIGGNKGFEISELKGLKDLHGEISIEGLNKVQSSMNAREANLSLKGISKLELKWDDDSGSEPLEMKVFNELKPCSYYLKMLVVKCYGGEYFPSWVGDVSFDRLVHVSLDGCRKCKSLPSLGRLPSLKKLLIQGMDKVEVIDLELTRTNEVPFHSLEMLSFEDMSSWKVWSTDIEAIFPCLRELQIKKCPNLIDLSLESIPSLRVLTIDECCESVLRNLVQAASLTTKLNIKSILGLTDEVWRGVIENFVAVEELSIKNCNEIRYMLESSVEASKVLVKLKELKISDCENLVSLGEKEEDEDNIGSNLLSSLRILDVQFCESMERLCCPNSIESLVIKWCSSIRHVSFPRVTTTGEGGQNLKSLTILGDDMHMEKINNTSMPMLKIIDIFGWRNLKSINQLSNSTHLTSLTIRECQSMESFSDLQLSNLTRLDIFNCESIESFPNLQLPNLTHLEIASCKNMKEFGDLQLPNLTYLKIASCKNMKAFGDLHIPNLISLSIEYCENLESFPNLQLPNLTHLYIFSCKNMKEFGDLHIPNLISWRIVECENLESFPDLQLSNLTMLKQVSIIGCPKIDARGIWPPNLSSLEIEGLKKPISEWGYQNFPASLVELRLWDEPDVRNFSQLSHLFPPSLTTLNISGFDNLVSLLIGLQHLTSLQHLEIRECPKLINLPETLLPALLSLRIDDCPKLKERCDGRGSHYWPQISHIPCIIIN